MKFLILILILLFPINSWAAPPTRSHSYVSGQTIDPDEVMTNEDNIFSYLQAGVDNYATGSVDADAIGANEVDASELKNTGDFTVNSLTNTATVTTSGISITGAILDGTSDFGAYGDYLKQTGNTVEWVAIRDEALVDAWAQLAVGTGTPVIDKSFNVLSVVDNNVGDYTVNWITSFADANYVCVITSGAGVDATGTFATGSVNVVCTDHAGNASDPAEVCIIAIE